MCCDGLFLYSMHFLLYDKMLLVLLLSFPVILSPFFILESIIHLRRIAVHDCYTHNTMSVLTVSKFKTIYVYLQKLQLNFRVKVDHLFSVRLIFD